MTRACDHEYRFTLSLASLLVAEQLTEREPDEQRSERKQMVAQEKWTLLRDTFSADLGALQGYGGTGPAMRQLSEVFEQSTSNWPETQRWLLLIDLLMSDAFAPYALKVTVTDLREVVGAIAEMLDLADEHTELLDAWHQTLRSRPPRWKKVIAPSHLTASGLLTSGPDAATTTTFATFAGFEGAAATARGFALLGGGSLALGGSDLAAGSWLLASAADRENAQPAASVVTAIATAPPTGDAGAPTHHETGSSDERDAGLPQGAVGLLTLGPAQAKVELLKLQLNFRLVIQHGRWEPDAPHDIATALGRIADDLQGQLDLERRLNDADAPRISGIEAILHDVRATYGVVEQAVEQATQDQAA